MIQPAHRWDRVFGQDQVLDEGRDEGAYQEPKED
jgi:hypothetical protein